MKSLGRIIARQELLQEAREAGLSDQLVRRIYEHGWSDAMRVSERTRLHEAEARRTALVTANDRFQRQLAEAREIGHRQGFQEGISQARAYTPPPPRDHTRTRERTYQTPPQPPPRSDATRKKLLEDVLAECRIISESNPQMAPGVNALRHRLKKLLKD